MLGNAYVMDSERQVVIESQFKLGEISVREFVRRLAKSDLYRTRFFDDCARYRYIELAFRHLLGRAPVDFQEMRTHAERLDSHGYEADIDSFLDSSDYQDNFGEWTVPFQRGWRTGRHDAGVHLGFQLLLAIAAAAEGKPYRQQLRLGGLLTRTPRFGGAPPVEAQGWSFRPADNLQNAATARHGVGEEGKTYRVEVTGYSANSASHLPLCAATGYYMLFDKL